MTIATAAGGERSESTVAQTAALSWRAVIALLRQPSLVVPSVLFPLFFAALGTSAFSRAPSLPGFPPVDSFLDFALAGAIVQGVMFGSLTGATALATDIENGFFDRLLAVPSPRVLILVGRLAGGMVYGVVQTVAFSVAMVPFGLTIEAGVVGVIVMATGGMITALGVGALMSAMALRTGSSEAVQGAFPLLFITLFFSSAFFPRQLMRGAYATIADLNPLSHLVEGFRGLVIDGLEWEHVARTLGVSSGIAVLTVTFAVTSLNTRVAAR